MANTINTSEGQKKIFVLDNMAFVDSGLEPQCITDCNMNAYSVHTWNMAFLGQEAGVADSQ